MRSLRITLHTRKPIVLPLAYNELLQGLLYACWRDDVPQLHEQGFTDGGSTYRLFTFGPLRSQGNIDAKKRTYRIDGLASFEVRSPIEDLLDILAGKLAASGTARIGAYELPVVNLEACDRLLFPKRALIHTLQPIVAKRKDEDGHSHYLSPDDDGWLDLIQANAKGKASALGIETNSTVQLIPIASDSLRKRVTRFKGAFITGWMGDFALSCDPMLMQVLYSCGLGARNSQGFGMFEIDNRPL